MVRPLGVLFLTAAFSGLVSSPIEGQVNFEVGPVLAYYRPVGNFRNVPVHSVRLPRTPQELSGIALGGEARAWVTGRIGIQLQGAVASSTVGKVTTPGGVFGPTSARVLMGAVQALSSVLPVDGRVSLWVSGGPGLVHHGGDTKRTFSCTSGLAGEGMGDDRAGSTARRAVPATQANARPHIHPNGKSDNPIPLTPGTRRRRSATSR